MAWFWPPVLSMLESAKSTNFVLSTYCCAGYCYRSLAQRPSKFVYGWFDLPLLFTHWHWPLEGVKLTLYIFQAPWIIDVNRPIRTWPARGAVVFDSYSVRYREGLELVLKQITCTIQGGERVSFYRVTCTTQVGQRAIQSNFIIDFYG